MIRAVIFAAFMGGMAGWFVVSAMTIVNYTNLHLEDRQ